MPDGAAKPATVLDPTEITLAGVYADALMSLAVDGNQAEELAQELSDLVDVILSVEGCQDLLSSHLLTSEKRVELVERIFKGQLGEAIMGLLVVMARNGRLNLLPAVVRQFRKRLNTREGKIEVRLTTAVPLDGELRSQLESMIREGLGAEPIVQTRVDENILGGVVMRIGDRVYDASVSAQLQQLGRRLMQHNREK